MFLVLASTEFILPKNSIWGNPQSPEIKKNKKGGIKMKELLFFVLGLLVGGLSGITIMCFLQINRFSKIESSAEKVRLREK